MNSFPRLALCFLLPAFLSTSERMVHPQNASEDKALLDESRVSLRRQVVAKHYHVLNSRTWYSGGSTSQPGLGTKSVQQQTRGVEFRVFLKMSLQPVALPGDPTAGASGKASVPDEVSVFRKAVNACMDEPEVEQRIDGIKSALPEIPTAETPYEATPETVNAFGEALSACLIRRGLDPARVKVTAFTETDRKGWH